MRTLSLVGRLLAACVVAAPCLAAGTAAAREPESARVVLDEGLRAYTPVAGVTGTVRSMGSGTMNNLMAHWSELFRRYYPNVKVEVEGKGSNTGPTALTESQAQFAPMSRAMEPAEIDAFRAKFGYEPTELRVGIDCVAIYVHRDNPLQSITLEQLERIYSVAGPDMTWDQVGVTDPAFAGRPISLYGRDSASGTARFFREHALRNKAYKPGVKEQAGAAGPVQAVAGDRFGIGYSSIGYQTANVRKVPVLVEGSPEPVMPGAETAYSGEYPLARFLYVYINHDQRRALDPLRAEFVRLMFSREGQESVIKDGYVPITAAIADEDLARVGLLGEDAARSDGSGAAPVTAGQ